MKLVKDTDQLPKKNRTISDEKAEEAVKIIIEWVGEDPEREGLKSTPKRVIKAYKEYFQGYNQDPAKYLSKTFTEVEGYDDMVIEKNISIRSHCEHHMAPIVGVAHVAYIPSKKVVGLSKLARVVEAFSKRLQTQERLTMQIAKTIMNVLQPRGVAVTIDASHQCMTNRGIKKEKTTTITNYFLGAFKDDLSFQNRYLRYINKD
jgi:GTP cyclohydrolase I